MARRDGMPRLELISQHLASGAGCNARPLLLVTQEDFLSPPVCIGSTGTFRVPGVLARLKRFELLPHRYSNAQKSPRRAAGHEQLESLKMLREGTKRLM